MLAILFLGAAISSSVLAAPTSLQPLHVMSDSPVLTGAQPLHPRSVGQTSEVATFQRRQEDVNFKSPLRVGGDLTIDDPKYDLEGKDGRDSPDNNRFRAVPVLDRRNEYQDRIKHDIKQVQAAWTSKSIVEDVYRNRATLNEWFTESENLKKDQQNHADYQGRRLTLADRFINTGAVFTLYEDMIGACGQLARTELPGGGDWKKKVKDDAREFLQLAQLLTQDRILVEQTFGTSEKLEMYKNVLEHTINNPLPVTVKKDEVLSDMVCQVKRFFSGKDRKGVHVTMSEDPEERSEHGHALISDIVKMYAPFQPHDYVLEGIAALLDGLDLIAVTPTGSGKTGYIAFTTLVVRELKYSHLIPKITRKLKKSSRDSRPFSFLRLGRGDAGEENVV
ncbi:hypothetical protein EV361DRAFT_872121 [Lentinula raphanica]|nr:hypothetical protein EV361DRAFT_872121 [Lentinula raphanica]